MVETRGNAFKFGTWFISSSLLNGSIEDLYLCFYSHWVKPIRSTDLGGWSFKNGKWKRRLNMWFPYIHTVIEPVLEVYLEMEQSCWRLWLMGFTFEDMSTSLAAPLSWKKKDICKQGKRSILRKKTTTKLIIYNQICCLHAKGYGLHYQWAVLLWYSI